MEGHIPLTQIARLIEKRDMNDNWVVITRDSLGNITGLIDSFGRDCISPILLYKSV